MEKKTQGTRNRYGKMEWAGAFGDVGTLIPFAVAYITIVKVDPLGLLLMFGVALVASGLYYRLEADIASVRSDVTAAQLTKSQEQGDRIKALENSQKTILFATCALAATRSP